MTAALVAASVLFAWVGMAALVRRERGKVLLTPAEFATRRLRAGMLSITVAIGDAFTPAIREAITALNDFNRAFAQPPGHRR